MSLYTRRTQPIAFTPEPLHQANTTNCLYNCLYTRRTQPPPSVVVWARGQIQLPLHQAKCLYTRRRQPLPSVVVWARGQIHDVILAWLLYIPKKGPVKSLMVGWEISHDKPRNRFRKFSSQVCAYLPARHSYFHVGSEVEDTEIMKYCKNALKSWLFNKALQISRLKNIHADTEVSYLSLEVSPSNSGRRNES